MILVGRPNYRIDNRSIKRGSRMSNLIVSFVESSNLCILGIIIFLGSYLAFLLMNFGACRDLHDKPKFVINRILYETLVAFSVLAFFRFVFGEGSTHSHVWNHP